jgi:hypothetical protein
MNDSFMFVFCGFIFTQGSAVCRALNLGCGITRNSERLTGTAKWDDIFLISSKTLQVSGDSGNVATVLHYNILTVTLHI